MNNKNIVAATLAVTAMLGFLVIFAVLGFGKVPPENKDFFNMGFIALIGYVSTAFGYYLGSSVGSAQKNSILAQMAAPDAPPPGGQAVMTNTQAGFTRLPVMLFLFAAFACAIAITGGCATTSPPVSGGAGGGTVSTTPMQTAGKSLLAAKSSILMAANATNNLCKAGKFNADKCSRAKAAYEATKPAYDIALDTYLLMSSGTGGDAAAFEAAILRLQNLAANLLLITGDSGGAQ